MRRIPSALLLSALVAMPLLAGCQKMQARMVLKTGNALYKDEKYREALEQFQKGLADDPDATFAWRSVGLTAMAIYRPGANDNAANKKFGEVAADAFKKYLQDYPSDEKVQEYLVTMLINLERYDEALTLLKADAQAHPGKPGVNQAIVTTLAKAGRLDEAFSWAKGPGADADPAKSSQVLYSIGVACWDKSYHDPMLDHDQRDKVVDTGLAAIQQALNIKPDYFEAMAYYNLLFREKAKLEADPVKAQEWIAKAEEWTKNAIALRDRLKAQEASKKTST